MKANKGKRLTVEEKAHIVELLRLNPSAPTVRSWLENAGLFAPSANTICRIARGAGIDMFGGGRPAGAKDKSKRKQSSKHRIPVLELAEQGMDTTEIMIVTGLKRGHVQYFLNPPTDGNVK